MHSESPVKRLLIQGRFHHNVGIMAGPYPGSWPPALYRMHGCHSHKHVLVRRRVFASVCVCVCVSGSV